MRILFENARILTLDEADHEYVNGSLLVENGRIAYVGPAKAFDAVDRRVDAGGDVLMPGFANAHTHVPMTLLRGVGSDLPLQSWLEDAVWPLEDKLTDEMIHWGTMLGIAEMLRFGVTSFLDMYAYEDVIAKAVLDSGIRAALSRGMMDGNGNGESGMAEARELIENWEGEGDGRIRTMVAPHAIYTCSGAYLRRARDLADRYKVPIHIHLSETYKEWEDCRKEHGTSPVRYLQDLGMLDVPVVAAHVVAVDDRDLDILAEKGVCAVHNPTSNLKLASGFAPVPDMLQKGIRVALGTDGAASNNNLSLWEEMNLAALIHKGESLDPTVLPVREVLRMATVEGAAAMGYDKVGALKKGNDADMILVDISGPHYQPIRNVMSHLVYAGQGLDVRMTMVQGRILMENGEYKTIDFDKVVHESARAAAQLDS
ncbi:amidohydrolase [Gehongia tenuis]|uniref:5-methylthioadenosine/S-adenosylhomocysteine deaminase n=1 Tax=Gehongia tenuis TaxID=2763655 RepID=A0A926D4J9_9FIRM|nr:amidohydrolase [Gehongia tenuis]MBC8531223.1 amidohydrolase [Gehongia tenuis]